MLHGYGLQRPGFLRQPGAEGFHVFVRQRQQRRQFGQRRLQVGDQLRHYHHREDRADVCQQLAVAVVDEAARGGQRNDVDAVVVREGGVLLVLNHHQPQHAYEEHAQQAGEQQKDREHPRRERDLLAAPVLHALDLADGELHRATPSRPGRAVQGRR